MLPSLRSLVRERALLHDVLQAAPQADPSGPASRSRAPRPRSAPPEAAKAAGDANGLQHLPKEVLAGIGERFLDARAWHVCKLGEASQHLSQVFLDEAVWQGLWRERFREASRSPHRAERSADRSPSVRLSYAQAHLLEARFRGGHYGIRGTLDNPHQGVAVLDVRMAPAGESGASAMAFAALRNGSIAVYDLDPAKFSHASPEAEGAPDFGLDPPRAAPVKELAAGSSGDPALCCLPVESEGGPDRGVLVAGYALGRLAAWAELGGQPCAPRAWESAHNGRVTALAVLEGKRLFSAASDGLVKAWSLESERFGEAHATLPGHQAAVVSVAASSQGQSLLLSGSHDRTMRLWDMRRGSEAGAAAQWQQKDWVTCVDFHPTAEHRILSSDKGVHIWDLRRPGASPVETTHRHRKLVSRFRVDPLRLASCSLDGCVKVSSLEEPGMRVASPLSSPQSSPTLRASSPPPMLLPEGLVEDEGDACTLRASTDYVLSIDFDATRLLAGSADGVVHVYDFSERSHFRRSPSSPICGSPSLSFRCGEPVDMELSGLQEIEVA